MYKVHLYDSMNSGELHGIRLEFNGACIYQNTYSTNTEFSGNTSVAYSKLCSLICNVGAMVMHCTKLETVQKTDSTADSLSDPNRKVRVVITFRLHVRRMDRYTVQTVFFEKYKNGDLISRIFDSIDSWSVQ